jgi:hypothetical protein
MVVGDGLTSELGQSSFDLCGRTLARRRIHPWKLLF